MCWLATSLKLCMQAPEKGEMFPNALMRGNLLRLITLKEAALSLLWEWSHRMEGSSVEDLKCKKKICGQVLLWHQLSEVFYKQRQDPWHKSVPAFGNYKQPSVTKGPHTRWCRWEQQTSTFSFPSKALLELLHWHTKLVTLIKRIYLSVHTDLVVGGHSTTQHFREGTA